MGTQICAASPQRKARRRGSAGDKAAADPVLLVQDGVIEIGTDAEDGTEGRVAVDGLEVFLTGMEVVVDSQSLPAVDGETFAAAPRVGA